MKPAVFSVLLFALLASPALAQQRDAADNPLESIDAFSCRLTTYGVARWEDMEATVLTGGDDLAFRVERIDLRRGAAMVVAAATVEVTARMTETGLNLIEQTPGGNFVLTTIFAGGGSADTFYAVHSRHLGEPTTPPSASQYYGTCEVAD